MKKILLLLICSVSLYSAELSWIHSYEKAVQKAKDENKSIMVFVEAEHCPYCVKMENEVLKDKYVVDSLEKFVPLKLDINSKDVKREFSKTSVTPTIYFITPDKKPLQDIVGYLNIEFFFWRLTDAENILKQIQEKEKR